MSTKTKIDHIENIEIAHFGKGNINISKKDEADSENASAAEVSPITILWLAANPPDGKRLRLDKENREIKRAIEASKFRDSFNFVEEWAVKASELNKHLLKHDPTIVHFSGHGTKEGLLLENDLGTSQEVKNTREVDFSSFENAGKSENALAALLGLSKKLRLVVLNACYSEKIATAIAEHIDFVVGMEKAITDNAAITFAQAFYETLGKRGSIDDDEVLEATKRGCLQIGIALNSNEINTPKLRNKQGRIPL